MCGNPSCGNMLHQAQMQGGGHSYMEMMCDALLAEHHLCDAWTVAWESPVCKRERGVLSARRAQRSSEA